MGLVGDAAVAFPAYAGVVPVRWSAPGPAERVPAYAGVVPIVAGLR